MKDQYLWFVFTPKGEVRTYSMSGAGMRTRQTAIDVHVCEYGVYGKDSVGDAWKEMVKDGYSVRRCKIGGAS